MRIAFYQLVLFINTTPNHDVYHEAAKIILKNIQQIPNLTITDVANLCYVSPATISRLCRKLNFDSYFDFIKSVTSSINDFNKEYAEIYFPNQKDFLLNHTDTKEIITQHQMSIIDTFKNLFNQLDETKIDELTIMMHKAKRIIFIGNYFAQNTAMQLEIELSYLGKQCFGFFNQQAQKDILNQTNEEDLIILSSLTGHFITSANEVMRVFKKSPAKKVVITQGVFDKEIGIVDLYINIGNNKESLISKFALTYIFEVIEMIYHIKYNR